MSHRQSRRANHIESIQKVFDPYDDKLSMRSASPQPHNFHPSPRWAIHRNASLNGSSFEDRLFRDIESVPSQIQKSKSLTTPVSSLFDTNKSSSIGDLHNGMDDYKDSGFKHIHIPKYNMDALCNQFDAENDKLAKICSNYQRMKETFSTIINEQSVCIDELLKELDAKNNEIKELKKMIKRRPALKYQPSSLSDDSDVNRKEYNKQNLKINRKFHKQRY